MSGEFRFRDVKLQWLQLLSCDKALSDSAKTIALYIITTHMNGWNDPQARLLPLHESGATTCKR
jgi:hypothetical protein